MAAATTRFDASRISFGEKVAGVSAVVLLVSLWLPWYGVSFKGGGAFAGKLSTSGNAWDWYGGRDFYLLLVALFVIGWVAGRALNLIPPNLGFDPTLVALVLGVLGVLFVFIGIVHVPNHGAGAFAKVAGIDFTRKWGLFVGFLATCGVTFGAWTAYNERRRGLVPAAAGPGGALGGPGAIGPTPGATAPVATSEPAAPAATPPASDPGPGAASPQPGPAAATASATPPPAPSTPPPPENPPADWYPDPHGQARLRWWDGSQWTDQTAN